MDYRPSKLQFTQTSISPYFSNGELIHGEINKIKSLWSWNRSEALNKFLPLEVRQDNYDGKMYCNNNRRLYMFRVLENEGYVTTVKVSLIFLNNVGMTHSGIENGFTTLTWPSRVKTIDLKSPNNDKKLHTT